MKLVNLKYRSDTCNKCMHRKESLIYGICKDCGECIEGGSDLFKPNKISLNRFACYNKKYKKFESSGDLCSLENADLYENEIDLSVFDDPEEWENVEVKITLEVVI